MNHTHFSRDSFFEITGHTDFRSGIEDVGGATANLIQRFVHNFFLPTTPASVLTATGRIQVEPE